MWKLQPSGLVEVEEFRIHYALTRKHPKLVGYLLRSSQDWQVDQGLQTVQMLLSDRCQSMIYG